jgi:acetyl-CoA acetyltransferase family protein
MPTALLLGGRRSPFLRRRGPLADVHAADLLGDVTAAALSAVGVDPADVDQVITGCVTKVGEQANNVGRTAWLAAGLPHEVPGVTIDAKCGSSQQAVHYAAGLVSSGAANLIVCNGVELMTRHPLGADVGDNADPYSSSYRDLYEVTSQGEAAERIARLWGLDRSYCDELALVSQERAAAAISNGFLAEEIVALQGMSADNGPRPSTRESLAALAPAFGEGGVLTAGNSSQITDGASCVVIASDRYVAERGLDALAQVEHQRLVGIDPALKLTGPIPATQEILKRSSLSPSDIDLAEVNEAFASVLGAWLAEVEIGIERTNVNGGAIALGHPVGATGARLLLTAGLELRRRGAQRALVTMCCGGGLGTATILRAV